MIMFPHPHGLLRIIHGSPGSAPAEPTLVPIPLKSVDISGTVLGPIGEIRVVQKYINNAAGPTPIDGIYVFPMVPLGKVSGITGFNVVVTKEPGVGGPRPGPGGFQTIYANSEPFQYHIASIQPGAEVTVTICYVTEIRKRPRAPGVGPDHWTWKNSLELILPKSILTQYYISRQIGAKRVVIPAPMDMEPEVLHSLSVLLEIKMHGFRQIELAAPTQKCLKKFQQFTTSPIVDLEAEDGDEHEAEEATIGYKLEIKGSYRHVDVDLVFWLVPAVSNVGVAYSEKFQGTTAILCHFLPDFTPPPAPKYKIPGPLPKLELIFVIDLSRMPYENMKVVVDKVKNALIFFLHSLHPGCFFNVVFAGGRDAIIKYLILFPQQSRSYDGCSFIKGFQFLKHVFKAIVKLGLPTKTEIYRTLQQIFSMPLPGTGYSRNIFMITNTNSNEQEIIELVQLNAHAARVFTIGFDPFVSHKLVEGIAQIGQGTRYFVGVSEESQIYEKILDQLRAAVCASFTDFQIDWIAPTQCQIPTQIPPIYDDNQSQLLVLEIHDGTADLVPTIKLSYSKNSIDGKGEQFMEEIKIDQSSSRDSGMIHNFAEIKLQKTMIPGGFFDAFEENDLLALSGPGELGISGGMRMMTNPDPTLTQAQGQLVSLEQTHPQPKKTPDKLQFLIQLQLCNGSFHPTEIFAQAISCELDELKEDSRNLANSLEILPSKLLPIFTTAVGLFALLKIGRNHISATAKHLFFTKSDKWIHQNSELAPKKIIQIKETAFAFVDEKTQL